MSLERKADRRRSNCELDRMDRGSRLVSDWQSTRSSSNDDHSAVLAHAVDESIRPLIGVKVIDHGQLDVREHGLPAGTSFVVIEADCSDEAYFARRTLESVARIPKRAWQSGWKAGRAGGRPVLQQRIFPTLESLT